MPILPHSAARAREKSSPEWLLKGSDPTTWELHGKEIKHSESISCPTYQHWGGGGGGVILTLVGNRKRGNNVFWVVFQGEPCFNGCSQWLQRSTGGYGGSSWSNNRTGDPWKRRTATRMLPIFKTPELGGPLSESNGRNRGNFWVRMTGKGACPVYLQRKSWLGKEVLLTLWTSQGKPLPMCMFRFKKNNDSHGPIRADAKHAAKCSLSAF